MKKWISLLLALCMALTFCAAFAEEELWTKEQYAAAAKIVTDVSGDYTGKTVILHSNDVHGQIDGYAYVAGLRTRFEGLGAEVITVDVGDFSQGDIYVSFSKGETAWEMMKAVKYDLLTLGNHEFDYGYERLMGYIAKSELPVICGNIYLDETGEPILPATKTIETKGGLKLGFFGLCTPETATKVNPALIKMITFSTPDKTVEAAQKAVDELKDTDLVFGLTHLGVDYESVQNGTSSLNLLEKIEGADLLIDGHSHYVMTAGQHGEPIQSTGTKFQYVGVIVIDNETKAIEDRFLVPTYVKNDLYEMNAADPGVKAVSDRIIADVDAVYNEVFATSEVWLNGERDPGNRTEETNLGDLITDAMIWSVVKEGGFEQDEIRAVVGITNGGGIRASIEAGDVARKDITRTLPFGNTIATAYVTGEELLEVLEASTFCTPEAIGGFPQTSGIEWTLDFTKEFDEGPVYVLNGKETTYHAPASIRRVSIQKVNGEEFNPKAVYAVVTNNFCVVGGDTYNVLGRSEEFFDTGVHMDEAVMEYVEQVLGGKITEETYGVPQGRMTIIQ